MLGPTWKCRIAELEDEIRALREALWAEWLSNHAEHCDNLELFHPAERTTPCGWPIPGVLEEHPC